MICYQACCGNTVRLAVAIQPYRPKTAGTGYRVSSTPAEGEKLSLNLFDCLNPFRFKAVLCFIKSYCSHCDN